jgi:hypothetical protein
MEERMDSDFDNDVVESDASSSKIPKFQGFQRQKRGLNRPPHLATATASSSM